MNGQVHWLGPARESAVDSFIIYHSSFIIISLTAGRSKSNLGTGVEMKKCVG
jgi:hypothetical protein